MLGLNVNPLPSVVDEVEAEPANRHIFEVSLAAVAVEVAPAQLFVATAVTVVVLCGVQAGAGTGGDSRAAGVVAKLLALLVGGRLGATEDVEGLRRVLGALLAFGFCLLCRLCRYGAKKRESSRRRLVILNELVRVLAAGIKGLEGVELGCVVVPVQLSEAAVFVPEEAVFTVHASLLVLVVEGPTVLILQFAEVEGEGCRGQLILSVSIATIVLPAALGRLEPILTELDLEVALGVAGLSVCALGHRLRLGLRLSLRLWWLRG